MRVRQIELHELETVLDFYKTNSYGGGVKSTDLIFCAELSGELIAVVRLCDEHQTLVLRGMRVARSFQRKGIGMALLLHLDKVIGHKICYCIPYGHLEDFYASIGFERIESGPDHLIERLEKYRLTDPKMIIMRRDFPKRTTVVDGA